MIAKTNLTILPQGENNSINTNKPIYMKPLFILLLPVLITVNTTAQSWTKQYDFVDDCICGLAKVSKNNKFGYVNNKGDLIVPLIYDEAFAFSEGRAPVRVDTKWGYLDSTGKMVIEPMYEEAGSFREGFACVRKNNHFGYIDTNYHLMIPFEFDMARGFAEGLAPVSNSKGLWGYINKKGDLVMNYKFNFADLFADGKARVMLNGKMIMIDKNGKETNE